MALRRLLVRGGQTLARQQQPAMPALASASARQLSGKSSFEDKEHAMEDLYIKVRQPLKRVGVDWGVVTLSASLGAGWDSWRCINPIQFLQGDWPLRIIY